MDPAIEVQGLTTAYAEQIIHQNLDLTVQRGEIVALVGGSGSGKTTLLRQIILLERPKSGSIHVLGQDILNVNETEAARLRRRFGVMFQQGALFSGMTVLENVMLPLQEHTALPLSAQTELGMLKVRLAGLPAEAARKYPRELSGGMLKRAAVARALALDPELLFLDEPSAGLDPIGANQLDELIVQLRNALGLTILMITHDLDSLWRVTDRVAFLAEKKVHRIASMPELTQDDSPIIQAYFQGPRGQAARQRQWTAKPTTP